MIFIGELGINHHGDIDKMKRMAARALDCGATYVKGQFYNPVSVLGRKHPDLQYAQKCYFTRQQHEDIWRYCNGIGIPYFVSVFNVGDIGWADSFCKVHKIASRMNLDQEFIARIDKCKKETFMSLQPNMSIKIPERFKLMWCIRQYPTPLDEITKYPYSKDFGLSSHCPDMNATAYAYLHGATVFENHLCESKEEEGCDISSSLTFNEYKELLKLISYGKSADNITAREGKTSQRV